jgi:capsular polysaccharide biosynthesis protein
MSRKPELLSALEELKLTRATNPGEREAFDRCLRIQAQVHYAHVLYREAGELAMESQFPDLAEEFAIRSLKSTPHYGGAYKLLGAALKAQGNDKDAAICHRYGLPNTVLNKYFHEHLYPMIRSEETTDSVTRVHAFDSELYKLNAPITNTTAPIQELSAKSLRSAEAFTLISQHASLWFDGFNTVVWDGRNQIIADACRGFPNVVQHAAKMRTPIHLEGRVCLLGNRNAHNYYHWMNDVIPRLMVLEASGITVASIDHFVVNPLSQNFQHETLAAFGIDDERIRNIENYEYVTCDELMVPTYGSNTLGLGQGAWNPRLLKSRFLNTPLGEQSARLYICRSAAANRKIINDTALKSMLKSKGFTPVNLETLTVRQQAELFNTASVVLGTHGAGLGNIAFCNAGTHVIELFRDHIAPCFWTISELTGLKHSVFYCGEHQEQLATAMDERYHATADLRRHADFTVNIDDLASFLDNLTI